MVDGSNVYVFRMNEETSLDILPPRVYTIRLSDMNGFYLQISKDKLDIPKKIYGNARERVDKCIHAYKERATSTGILLTGDKGTGKTLMSSLLANRVIDELKLPVLLVKDAYEGAQFISFVESIGECCLMFDEFGKMYTSSNHVDDNEISQSELLSLMDGVDKTKRMFILTENSELDISEFMLNRPSRIYYHFRYKKLDEDSITGYCKDYEIHDEIINDIIELSRATRIFSFDMLQSIVEEHVRFGSSIADTIADLNIDLSEKYSALYEVTKVIEKTTKAEKDIVGSPFVEKPVRKHDYFYAYIKSDEVKKVRGSNRPVLASSEEIGTAEIHVRMSDMAYERNGECVFDTEKYIVVIAESRQNHIDYSKLL